MRALCLVPAVAIAASLAGCGPKTEAPASREAAQSVPASGAVNGGAADMGNMAMPAGAKMAKSSGTVTAIDKAMGKITLAHGPIPEVGWPAMTMVFSARPALLDGIAVGDKVAFEASIASNAGEVTAITKQ